MILLAIATNLPEIAITVSAALSQNLEIATGNILGGIAVQTVVLVLLDVFGVQGRYSLTYLAASLTLVLEGLLVIAVLIVAIMGTQLPASAIFARVTPTALLITLLWLSGLWLVKLQDYQLAVSDIFGGNAFLPVLFLLANLISGQAVLPRAEKVDIYISGLGILLTTVYIAGLIFRPQQRILRLGIDSLIVLVLYGIGTLGLIALR